jgi:hypothetical protein
MLKITPAAAVHLKTIVMKRSREYNPGFFIFILIKQILGQCTCPLVPFVPLSLAKQRIDTIPYNFLLAAGRMDDKI